MKAKNKANRILIYMTLIVLSVGMIFPFYWMLRSSFMSDREILSMPMQWLPSEYNFDNYIEAFKQAPFGRYFLNSIIIVSLNIIGHVFSASFGAFGFARLKFKGRDFCFALLLSTMMIPYTVLMIPQFILWQSLGFFNTFVPLILPAFFGGAFNIFLVKQFYMGIPKAYDEAALVDGANFLIIYSRIILPLSKPVLMSVGVFTFMNAWNDFMGPLIYLDRQELKTVSLGLQMFMGQNKTEWNLLLAAATAITLPMIVVYFFAQRYFVEGITFAGVKG